MWIEIGIIALIFSCASAIFDYRFLNIIQLEGYKIKFIKKMTKLLYYAGSLFLVIVTCCVLINFIEFGHMIAISPYIIPCLILAGSLIIFNDKEVVCLRQKLVWTKRMFRLFFGTIIVQTALYILILWIEKTTIYDAIITQVASCFMLIFCVLGCGIAFYICQPLEKFICYCYEMQCKKTLKGLDNLVIIGITGSYGKTSVKNILQTILQDKYNSFCTPSNFNTPMGICKAVKLMPKDTQVFVVEMGARYKDDIKKLCKIATPNYCILTGIAPQHLETFKSVDNIIKAKYQIVEYSATNSVVVFNAKDNYCKKMYEKCIKEKYLSINEDFYIQNYKCGKNGSKFDIVYNNQVYNASTALIGLHNIDNIMMSARISLKLGMSMQDIVNAISKIKQVPHRLEVINAPNGVIIIDDSYNSNQLGAKNAINCLEYFEGKKIIVAQGLVEMGNTQYDANKELGAYMANKANYYITFGVNSKAIVDGLKQEGESPKNIFSVQDMDDARKIFSDLLKSGDVVLFQNDLTDNFN